ncbi:unnamed protein product [Lymnaea stagnalis]|uniref:Uncharacterized protein n=1 Tax=Lymnaea stagnalis TaxID=6523 RepID=A0AAV2ID46_LYMST
MRTALVIMTGIGFTLGVVFGLLLQLPIDTSLPADSAHPQQLHDVTSFRSRKSLSEGGEKLQSTQLSGASLTQGTPANYFMGKNPRPQGHHTLQKLQPAREGAAPLIRENGPSTRNGENPISIARELGSSLEGRKNIHSPNETGDNSSVNKDKSVNGNARHIGSSRHRTNISSEPQQGRVLRVRKAVNSSAEDVTYLSSIVNGVLWSPRLEDSCPKSFQPTDVKEWRRRVEDLDVVKMEEGCGRMQNRLITFRDASKACARYRLNSDQIQGEIFSYYLAQLLNISNMPPTLLAQVDALSPKWNTVHLQLSLAQWADTKLVVLTQHIDGLSPAHIPGEFREDSRMLEPTLGILGGKSHEELCELLQWSDLIVFDYLTANLDRVINNMFNKQWNDQMMSNPAHNLERQRDGTLVFLDNESGLFHGYRLLDKYAGYHQTLLQALCVFRADTVAVIKRLHGSSSVGQELHELFASNEALHKQIAVIPEKNLKILQQRLGDVHQQIVNCEKHFNR